MIEGVLSDLREEWWGELASFGRSISIDGERALVGDIFDDGPSNDQSSAGAAFLYESLSTTIPVELADFRTHSSAETVRLSWQTVSETNNSGFVVQHKDGNVWTKIGHVESKSEGGTTTETLSYRYTVEDLSVGTHQFRLRQVDLDGSSTLSKPVSVRVQLQEALKLNAPTRCPAAQLFRSRSRSRKIRESLSTIPWGSGLLLFIRARRKQKNVIQSSSMPVICQVDPISSDWRRVIRLKSSS